jgi:hypothetical protein
MAGGICQMTPTFAGGERGERGFFGTRMTRMTRIFKIAFGNLCLKKLYF